MTTELILIITGGYLKMMFAFGAVVIPLLFTLSLLFQK